MSNHNLFPLSADGAVVLASSEAILIAARQVLAHRVRRGASLQSPQKTGEYLTARLGHLDYEVFGLILLDLCVPATYVQSLTGTAEIA
jgi:DNA repair protein RadC